MESNLVEPFDEQGLTAIFDAFYTSKEYLEFCSNLDELSELSAYDESMIYDDTKASLKSDIFKIGRNTRDTTRDIFKIYKNATDAKGKTYKGICPIAIIKKSASKDKNTIETVFKT